jgi:hypothetical protein
LLTSEAAVGKALGSAISLRSYLASVQWEAIDAAASLRDHRAGAAETIRARVAEALEADEHAVGLQSALQEEQSRAIRLLADTRQPPPAPPPRSIPDGGTPPPPPPPGEVLVEERSLAPVAAAEAVALLDDLRQRVSAESNATLTIGWRLTRPGGRAGG